MRNQQHVFRTMTSIPWHTTQLWIAPTISEREGNGVELHVENVIQQNLVMEAIRLPSQQSGFQFMSVSVMRKIKVIVEGSSATNALPLNRYLPVIKRKTGRGYPKKPSNPYTKSDFFLSISSVLCDLHCFSLYFAFFFIFNP